MQVGDQNVPGFIQDICVRRSRFIAVGGGNKMAEQSKKLLLEKRQ